MTTLITGARGAIGAGLVRRLHDGGHDLRAASRAPDQLTVPDGVAVATVDLADLDTFGPALNGVSDVFLYAEPTGIAAFLAAAVAAGVRRVVLLSSESVTRPGAEHNALAHHHILVERALLAAPLTVTVLRPGAFAANALSWASPIRAGRPVEQVYPDAHTDPIHPDDIIDVAELALTTDTLDGMAVTLGGPESLSFRDQVCILGELLGRDIELRELTREQASDQMGRFMPAPVLGALLDYWADAPLAPACAENSVTRITGRPGRTFGRWASERLDAFR